MNAFNKTNVKINITNNSINATTTYTNTNIDGTMRNANNITQCIILVASDRIQAINRLQVGTDFNHLAHMCGSILIKSSKHLLSDVENIPRMVITILSNYYSCCLNLLSLSLSLSYTVSIIHVILLLS